MSILHVAYLLIQFQYFQLVLWLQTLLCSLGQFTLILEPQSTTTTSYNVSINDSPPISIPVTNNTVTPTNYNVSIGNSSIMLVSIPTNGELPYMLNFSNLISDAVYNVTVVAINCAGNSCTKTITGRPSEFFRYLLKV